MIPIADVEFIEAVHHHGQRDYMSRWVAGAPKLMGATLHLTLEPYPAVVIQEVGQIRTDVPLQNVKFWRYAEAPKAAAKRA